MKDRVLELGCAASGLPLPYLIINCLPNRSVSFVSWVNMGSFVEQELNNQATYDDRCHKVVPASGPEHERYRCDG
jgi:hypothetical protein